jgi:hypothetical protein
MQATTDTTIITAEIEQGSQWAGRLSLIHTHDHLERSYYRLDMHRADGKTDHQNRDVWTDNRDGSWDRLIASLQQQIDQMREGGLSVTVAEDTTGQVS